MARHKVQVVTQWDTNRTDWLLGTTINAPAPASSYNVDGVSVRRITLPTATRVRLAPRSLVHHAVQGADLKRMTGVLVGQVVLWTSKAIEAGYTAHTALMKEGERPAVYYSVLNQ